MIHDLHSLIEGGSFRHFNACHKEPLILIRNKSGGNHHIKCSHPYAHRNEKSNGQFQPVKHPGYPFSVAFSCPVKGMVEFPEEQGHRSFPEARVILLQQHAAEGRCQGQCHEGGNGNGNGNRHGKLFVQHTDHPADKSDGKENRSQYGCRGNDRTLHLIHGPFRCFLRIDSVLFHMFFYVFDDYDCIIHNHPDGKNHGEEGQRINGKSEKDKGSKRSDNGYRNGQNRNQRRSPFLEEQEHHQNNQKQRFHKGGFHFADGCIDEGRIVHNDDIIQIRREAFSGFLHDLLHLGNRIQRIGIARKLDAEPDSVMSVDFGIIAFIGRTGLYGCHILQIDEFPIGAGLYDNISELLRRGEASLHLCAVGLFLRSRCRHAADGSCQCRYVLLLDGTCHIGCRQAPFRQLIRIQPDSHGIAGPESIDVTDSVYPFDLIQKINIGIILQESLIIGPVRRVQIGHEHHIAGSLAHRDALGLHIRRE